MHLRLPPEIIEDISIIERAHGLDTSNAIRMILTEARHALVDRARQILREREGKA